MWLDLVKDDDYYSVNLYVNDSQRKLGEVLLDQKRNQYMIISNENNIHDKESLGCNKILYDVLVKHIASKPDFYAMSGEMKSYALEIVEKIAEEYPNPNKIQEVDTIQLAINEIKQYNRELISENQVLR